MPKQTFWNLPADKRDRFLDAAINEFADNDYKNASISRLCREVGIAKGSFYQYFNDKQDLLRYLIDVMIEEKQRLLNQIEIPESSHGMFDRLRWMFRLQVQFDLQHPRLAEVGYRVMNSDFPFKDEMLGNLKAQSLRGYQEILTAAVADQSLRGDLNLDVAAFLLNSVMTQLAAFLEQTLQLDNTAMYTRDLTDEQWNAAFGLFDQLLDLLESGMGQPS